MQDARRAYYLRLAIIAGLLLLITALHYLTTTQKVGAHDVYRRLYYVPIVLGYLLDLLPQVDVRTDPGRTLHETRAVEGPRFRGHFLLGAVEIDDEVKADDLQGGKQEKRTAAGQKLEQSVHNTLFNTHAYTLPRGMRIAI